MVSDYVASPTKMAPNSISSEMVPEIICNASKILLERFHSLSGMVLGSLWPDSRIFLDLLEKIQCFKIAPELFQSLSGIFPKSSRKGSRIALEELRNRYEMIPGPFWNDSRITLKGSKTP